MSDQMDKTIREIQKRIGEWTDERGYNFIKELILSGDIHIWKTNPTAFISERDYDERPKTVTFKDANLWAYEPYRGMREKESQLAEANRELDELRELNKMWEEYRFKDWANCIKTLNQIIKDLTDKYEGV